MTSNPTLCKTTNIADRDNRYLVCHQARETLDFITLFKHQAAALKGLEGRMWFVCTGRTAEHNEQKLEKLYGRLFLFHNKTQWEKAPKDLVKDARDEVENLERGEFEGSLADTLDNSFSRLENQLMETSSFHVGFELIRCGEVKIIWDEKLPISPNAPTILEEEQKAIFNHLIASQLFFFLRDICHEHQHHNPKTDTIVDLHEDSDDYDWRVQTLYALYRKIIQYKRTRSPEMVVNSLGTLAYTQAFKILFERSVEKTGKKLPDYSDSSLKDSLHVAHIDLAERAESSRQKQDSRKNLLFGVLGTVLAFASLNALTGKTFPDNPSKLLEFGGKILVDQTGYILVLVFALVFIITYRPAEWQVFRNLIRWLQPLKKKVAIGVLIFLFIISFLGTLSFLLSEFPLPPPTPSNPPTAP